MKKYLMIVLSCLLVCAFSGCSKENNTDLYHQNMEQFFENVSNLNTMINDINYDNENAISSLLGYLDMLDTTFSQMASLTPPSEFSEITVLSQSASENMSNAVSLFHLAYEEGYDEDSEKEACEYYETANSQLKEIISILRNTQ